jgi:hypothetical protein
MEHAREQVEERNVVIAGDDERRRFAQLVDESARGVRAASDRRT